MCVCTGVCICVCACVVCVFVVPESLADKYAILIIHPSVCGEDFSQRRALMYCMAGQAMHYRILHSLTQIIVSRLLVLITAIKPFTEVLAQNNISCINFDTTLRLVLLVVTYFSDFRN